MNTARPPRELDDVRYAEIARTILNFSFLGIDPRHSNPTLDALSRHDPADLFAYDPKWYTLLLRSTQGLEAFGRLLVLSRRYHGHHLIIDDYDNDVDLAQLMRSCFLIQSTLAVRSIRVLSACFPRSFFKAIRHYTHPDQAGALAQLKLQLRAYPLPFTLPEQHNVPPKALPLLFPQIDTAQFAPQFGWFIYLLSQFSPVDEVEYTTKLSTLLDTTFHPTAFLSLKPGLTLHSVFTHNHLINSYDEFLHHKLPQVLPLIQSADQRENRFPSSTSHSPTSPQNLLFPYFPDQHPLLPSITSKDDFSALLSDPTEAFTDYFTYMFILGPWIQSTTPIPHFDADLVSTPFSLSTKLAFHQYRAWCRESTTPTTNNRPLNSASSNNQTTTHNLQPPDFATSPLTLLALTVVPDCSLSFKDILPSIKIPQTITWPPARSPIVTETYLRFLFHILAHYFPNNESTRDTTLNGVLTELLSGYELDYPLGALFNFSYSLYQHGCTTLHQQRERGRWNEKPEGRRSASPHLSDASVAKEDVHQHIHRLFLTVDLDTLPLYQLVSHFLTQPLITYDWEGFSWDELAKHIALCVHAGFLSPLPLTPPPPPPPPTHPPNMHPFFLKPGSYQQLARSHRYFPDHASQLLAFHSTLHAMLVRLTGFVSYFPQSTQLIANRVHTNGPRMEFSPTTAGFSILKDANILPFLPPHSSTIPDPRDAVPHLKAALVDDNGKLFAIKYASGLADDDNLADGVSVDQAADLEEISEMSDDLSEETDNEDQFSWGWSTFNDDHVHGAPRHNHIFQGSDHNDLQICVDWPVNRAIGPETNPYLLPRVSAQDLAWIDSEANEKNLNLPETRELQKELTAYYRQVNQVETEMVLTLLHKVLDKAYAAGLCDASNAGQKRKQPPNSTHSASTKPAAPPNAAAAQPSLLQIQPRAYPLPTLPKMSNMINDLDCLYDHKVDFSRQRGALFWDEGYQNFIFYDHNYAPRLFRWDSISDMPADVAQGLFDAEGRPKTDSTASVSVVDYFRQCSEWALELLMVGCFGLDAASTQSPRPPMVHTPQQDVQTRPSFQPSTNPHIQLCKEHLLQHLPIFVNAIQPTPTLPPRLLDLQQNQARLNYYYDTLTHITLLTTLPLYDTLASLTYPPAQSPRPGQPQ